MLRLVRNMRPAEDLTAPTILEEAEPRSERILREVTEKEEEDGVVGCCGGRCWAERAGEGGPKGKGEEGGNERFVDERDWEMGCSDEEARIRFGVDEDAGLFKT